MQSTEFFYASNGAVLKDLNGLSGELKNMNEGTFSYHVNDGKNDFASWVKGVLKEEELANKLLKSKNKEEMIKHIEKRLKALAKLSKSNKGAVINQIKEAILNE